MEGGDHHEEVPEAVIPQETTEKEPDVVEEIPDKSSEALTDSILDDDLVVIPSQNELQQELATTDEPVSEPSPAGEPEPQAVIPATEPSQPVATPQSQPIIEPSQPVIEPPQPVAEPPKPEVELPQPVIEPPQPVIKPSQPVEPVQSQSEPISPPPQVQARPEPSINTRPAPATSKPIRAIENDDDDDDFEDETITERLIGLTEMFPETLCMVAGVTFSLSVSGMKKLFNFSRSALWIGSTSFMILILPIVFETEMVHMEQAQIQRQKQILLGPNAATAGGMTGGLTPPMPGVSVAAPPPEAR